MAQKVTIELNLPDDFDKLRLPPAVHDRLQHLLDKQSREGKLSRSERLEAEGLVDVSELLSLLKLRAKRARGDE
jgi:hypothetical protein